MFEFFKNLFNCKDNNQVQTEQASLPVQLESHEEITVHVPKKPPACSYCNATSHNIIKCEQVKAQLEQIKNYCSGQAHQKDVIETTTWLKTFDNKVLARYIITHNINSYMWNNCAIYYENNISRTSGKEKNIQLIIGYECVLPAHPEIRIKKTQLKKLSVVENTKSHDRIAHSSGVFGSSLMEKAIIMNAGIATGIAINKLM